MPKLIIRDIKPISSGIINTVSKNAGVLNVRSKNLSNRVLETDFRYSELINGMSIGPGLWMTYTYPTYQIINTN